MSRERPGYREALERLSARFPDREAITVKECATILNMHEQTITDNRRTAIPIRKVGRCNRVFLTDIARFQVGMGGT